MDHPHCASCNAYDVSDSTCHGELPKRATKTGTPWPTVESNDWCRSHSQFTEGYHYGERDAEGQYFITCGECQKASPAFNSEEGLIQWEKEVGSEAGLCKPCQLKIHATYKNYPYGPPAKEKKTTGVVMSAPKHPTNLASPEDEPDTDAEKKEDNSDGV